jgi:hypothetical protein
MMPREKYRIKAYVIVVELNVKLIVIVTRDMVIAVLMLHVQIKADSALYQKCARVEVQLAM